MGTVLAINTKLSKLCRHLVPAVFSIYMYVDDASTIGSTDIPSQKRATKNHGGN